MFTWIERRNYRKKVLSVLQQAMPEVPAHTLKASPNIDYAIDDGFKTGRSKEELAVNIAASLLSNAIEQLPNNDRRQRTWQAIQTWVGGDGYLRDPLQAKILPDTDAFLLRLQWALYFCHRLYVEKLIGENVHSYFYSEVFGALAGKSSRQRHSERVSNIIDEAFDLPVLREGDDGPLLPSDLGSADLPILAGVVIEVRLASTANGIILVREDDGKQVTEQRALTQDDLHKAPLDAKEYTFVNFQPPSGELYSCLIQKPNSEVYGSMRAFWWALAKSHVVSTDAMASSTRMTSTAFARVCGTARGMWDMAIKQAGSIERMRDLFLPERNQHLTAINAMKENATGEAAKLGIKIALAMVLAAQSEDPKLEAFAFQRFKRFLWLPGEEPREFLQHSTR